MEANKQTQHIHGDRTTTNTNGKMITAGQKKQTRARKQQLQTRGENEEVIERRDTLLSCQPIPGTISWS